MWIFLSNKKKMFFSNHFYAHIHLGFSQNLTCSLSMNSKQQRKEGSYHEYPHEKILRKIRCILLVKEANLKRLRLCNSNYIFQKKQNYRNSEKISGCQELRSREGGTGRTQRICRAGNDATMVDTYPYTFFKPIGYTTPRINHNQE